MIVEGVNAPVAVVLDVLPVAAQVPVPVQSMVEQPVSMIVASVKISFIWKFSLQNR